MLKKGPLLNASALIGQGLAFSKVYLFHIACLFTLISFFKLLKHEGLKKLKSISIPILLLVYVLLSLTWSTNVSAGILEAMQFALGLYLLAYNEVVETNRKILEKVVLVILILNILISLGEAIELFRYPLSQYSEYPRLFHRNFYDWYPQQTDLPTGFHWNPNTNSFFILIFSPIVLTSLSVYYRFIYILICSFIMFKTGSKLLLVGWAFFLFSWTITLLLQRLSAKKIVMGFAFAAVLIATIWLSMRGSAFQQERYAKIVTVFQKSAEVLPTIISRHFTGKSLDTNLLNIESSMHERLLMFDGIIGEIANNPWMGVGAGSLNDARNVVNDFSVSLRTPHFYILEVWAKYGVFFFLAYASWILLLIKKLSVCGGRGYTAIASILLLVVFSPVVSTLSYFLPVWVLYSYGLSVTREASFEGRG
jgi:O-antigen ligase